MMERVLEDGAVRFFLVALGLYWLLAATLILLGVVVMVALVIRVRRQQRRELLAEADEHARRPDAAIGRGSWYLGQLKRRHQRECEDDQA